LIEPTDGAICAISAKVLTFKVLLILLGIHSLTKLGIRPLFFLAVSKRAPKEILLVYFPFSLIE
jgi:hypothetical protein